MNMPMFSFVFFLTFVNFNDSKIKIQMIEHGVRRK